MVNGVVSCLSNSTAFTFSLKFCAPHFTEQGLTDWLTDWLTEHRLTDSLLTRLLLAALTELQKGHEILICPMLPWTEVGPCKNLKTTFICMSPTWKFPASSWAASVFDVNWVASQNNPYATRDAHRPGLVITSMLSSRDNTDAVMLFVRPVFHL
jgi:hypothetical protein